MIRVAQSIAAAALAALAAACLALMYLKQGITAALFFNSDASYLAALYYDLFERGGRLSAWFLTPAPYFFPDWPLYFGLRWLSGGVYPALAGVMAMQALLLWGLSALLLRRFTSTANALAAAALGTVLICLPAVQGIFPYTYVMLASYHFGAMLALLAGAALLLPLLERPATRGQLAAVLALTTLMVLSDRLYVLQFVLPALALLVLMRARLSNWRPLALVLLAGCVAGVLLYKSKLLVANGVSLPWHLAPRQAGANLRALADIGAVLWQHYPLLALYSMAYYALLALLAPGTLLNRGWRLRDGRAAWVCMLNLASSAGLLLAMIVSNGAPTDRYLIPAFLLPVLLGPALAWSLAAQWRGEQVRHHGGLTLLLGGALLAWPLCQAVGRAGPVQHEYYPAEIACADRVFAQYDLRHGYAGYWDAAWVAMASQRKPVIALAAIDLREHHWITTAGNYQPRYDFALVTTDPADDSRPQATVVIARNGAPQAAVQCGPLHILVYPRDALQPLAPLK